MGTGGAHREPVIGKWRSQAEWRGQIHGSREDLETKGRTRQALLGAVSRLRASNWGIQPAVVATFSPCTSAITMLFGAFILTGMEYCVW